MSKSALISGVLGQDGSFLAELLLGKGYRVYGFARHGSPNMVPGVELLHGDMRDALSLETAVWKAWPDEVYNLAGQVFVPASWSRGAETFDVNTSGLQRLLEIVQRVKPNARVYQASSSEMYGNYNGACDENTVFSPVSPYGISKFAAHKLVNIFRDKGMFVVGGILFNHESERRSVEMVTRKITRAVAAWATGGEEKLVLGDLQARRDWGYAGDYVEAMWKMLQQEQPQDFVIGTGTARSVQEFLLSALNSIELPYFSTSYIEKMVTTQESLQRPNEIKQLIANPTKAKVELNWEPSTPFEVWVRRMVVCDIKIQVSSVA